ncbi:hypothetical protein [Actinoplanes sp. NPDC051851]|uniref:hypothetical protein n=1 Tax=Actinoplanes sp. NPDC051851 TaxID=3154753 RepID=UPI003448BFC4
MQDLDPDSMTWMTAQERQALDGTTKAWKDHYDSSPNPESRLQYQRSIRVHLLHGMNGSPSQGIAVGVVAAAELKDFQNATRLDNPEDPKYNSRLAMTPVAKSLWENLAKVNRFAGAAGGPGPQHLPAQHLPAQQPRSGSPTPSVTAPAAANQNSQSL